MSSLIWVSTSTGVPSAEAFNSTAGFGTPVIVDTNTGISYYYKPGVGVSAVNSPGASGLSAHSALTGLGADDHTQYHTDARGDARYAPLAHVGSSGAAHAIATHAVAGFLSAADKTALDALIASPSDPWTYVVLVADATVSSTTPVSTLLQFSPAASHTYIAEGQLMLETTDATVGPCPGVSWPSGLTRGVISIRVPDSSTTSSEYHFDNSAPGRAVSTGLPINTPFPAEFAATLSTGGAPSGAFAITISTEV